MKNILFILHYPPPKHGAAIVGEYIRGSQLINDTFHCSYINLGTSISVSEVGKGGIRKWTRYFNVIWTTCKSLIKSDPNLVYLTLTASGKGFYKDAVVVILAKVFGKKVVFHFHNKGVQRRQHKWQDNLLYNIVFRNAEVILLSKHLYSDIEKYVPKEKVHYCPNGIPASTTITLQEGKHKDSPVRLLFLSNLLESKGVFVLLECCSLLKAKQLPFECVFIGAEGDITVEQLHRKIDFLGIGSCVHYHGKKYGMEKEVAYSKADIFVFPTHFETFGLVNLEAMQFSLPVVSTLEGLSLIHI